jgi:hypothetical protein
MGASGAAAPTSPAATSALGPDDAGAARRRALIGVATLVAVAGATFGLAFNGGTYALSARDALAVALWWGIGLGVALGRLPVSPIPRAAWVAGGLLAAFAAWTALSALWAPSAETAIVEGLRASVYLGVFTAAVIACPRGRADRWSDGLGGGIAVLGGLSLLTRLFPHLVSPTPLGQLLSDVATRLNYPMDYWNGLAIFVALGFPLLLRAAAADRHPALRGLAVVPVPVLAAVIYLTSSRGGAAVAIVATLVFLALTARRLQALAATAIGGAGAGLAIVVIHARPVLIDGPLRGHHAVVEGRGAALLILLICLAAGLAQAGLARLAPRGTGALPGWARAAGWGLAMLALAGGVVALDPAKRVREFKRTPGTSVDPSLARTYLEAHLLSAGGSGRWQFWSAAADEFDAHPLAGRGAGTFEAWWARHGSLAYFVRDAHSLWLETLGELGIVGFLLAVGAFGAVLAAALARLWHAPPAQRATIAALLGCVLGFVVGAAIDWMWEMTAVGVVAVAALGLLAGPATAPAPTAAAEAGCPPPGGRTRLAARLAVGVLALFLIAVNGRSLLAQRGLERSATAAGGGHTQAAVDDALRARGLAGWSSAPPLQLALVYEQAGNLGAARLWIGRALGINADDWRLWLTASRIQTRQGDVLAARRSYERARRLNPRSPLFSRT